MTLERDDGPARGEQLVHAHDFDPPERLNPLSAHEDGQVAEAALACALEQRQPLRGRPGDQRGTHGRSDRPLVPGLDLDLVERQQRALLGERPRGRGQPLTLGDRAVERSCARVGEARLLEQAGVEERRRLAQPFEQSLGGLAPQLQPL